MSFIRFDRAATIYLFAPLARARRTHSGPGLPILMYHSISNEPELGISEYFKVNTSLEIFRRQMYFLRDEGFQVVDLEKAARSLQKDLNAGKKQVVLTFDDGFADFYDKAFPVLQECGFTASVFLPTAFVGKPKRRFKQKECLSWAEVQELYAAGIRFGSHTVNHPILADLEWEEVEKEIRTSKEELEQNLGEPVRTFSYPFAFPQTDGTFVKRLEQLLYDTGYVCGVSTVIGFARPDDSLLWLKRLPVNSCDDQALFRAKLEGGYNWLAIPQTLAKRAKRCLRSISLVRRMTGGAGCRPVQP